MTKMSSLPSTFFQTIPNRPQNLDSRQPYYRQCLRHVLQVAEGNRWIADWLFTDPHLLFHPNLPLSPEAFDSTIALRIFHTFLDLDVPPPNSISPTPTPVCPVSGRSGPSHCPVIHHPHSSYPTNPRSLAHPHFHAADSDMLMLPVASLDGLCVGYAFGTGANLSSPPPITDFVGRFAYDARANHLLIVMPPPTGVSQNRPVTVVMSVSPCQPGRGDKRVREHVFFTVPPQEYSFEYLPNHVYSMCTAESRPEDSGQAPLVEALDALFNVEDPATHFVESILAPEDKNIGSPTTGSDSSTEHSANLAEPDVALALLEAWTAPDPPAPALPVETAAKRYTPWVDGSYGQTADGVGIPRRAGGNGTSSGAFDMTSLGDALQGIMSSLKGSFYSSRTRHEPFDYSTGKQIDTGFRNVIARLEPVEDEILTKMKFKASSIYFSTMTSIRIDQALWLMSGRQGEAGRYIASKRNGDIRSRLQPTAMVPAGRAVVLNGVTAAEGDETRRKAERLEEKKRRNRLSAAKSNLKRKEFWDGKKRDLRELRERVSQLESKKRVLVCENEMLRRQVETR